MQTPTLAMICRRYLENKHFASVPYWKLCAQTEKDGISIKTVSTERFSDEAEAQQALSALRRGSTLSVVSVSHKRGSTAPPLLYDLTALQKEANRKHGFSAEKTLSIAQSLYEKKLSSYPRTGSRYISEDVFEEVVAILTSLGEGLPTPLNPHSVDNAKVSDHHAIIPTGERAGSLSSDEGIIYEMICLRFVEAFSQSSEEERLQVQLTDGSLSYSWQACRMLSLGWRAVAKAQEKLSDLDTEDDEAPTLSILPSLTEGEALALHLADITSHKTKPKPLYTEASLLSAMETAGREVADEERRRAMADCGIGTPATRANIIETLILRAYVRREKQALVPTDKGLAVYEIVKDKRIANAEMTGTWELALAGIETGKVKPEEFMRSIISYTEQITEELRTLKPEDKQYPSYRCPKCGDETFGIYAKVGKCRGQGCGFVIFRELCGTFLSEDNLRDLLSKRRTPILKGLMSKSGRKFNARLVLKDDHTTALEFEGKGEQKR